MSSIARIKASYPTLTKTDQQIADYVLNHMDLVIHYSVQELAKLAEVSPAAIVRFSKALGYKGFPALKIDLAKSESTHVDPYEAMIREQDSIDDINHKLTRSLKKTLDITQDMTSSTQIETVASMIENANTIYLYGLGSSGLVALDLYYKLNRIAKNAICNTDPHVFATMLANGNSDSVLIVVSYSGKRKIVNQLVKEAAKQGIKIISITSNQKSPLAKISNQCIIIPSTEGDIRLGAINSRLSSMCITDMIYLSIARLNIDSVQEHVIKTRLFIDQIE